MNSKNNQQNEEMSAHQRNSVDHYSIYKSSIQDTQENLNGKQFLPLSAAIKKNFNVNNNNRRLMGINSRVEE